MTQSATQLPPDKQPKAAVESATPVLPAADVKKTVVAETSEPAVKAAS